MATNTCSKKLPQHRCISSLFHFLDANVGPHRLCTARARVRLHAYTNPLYGAAVVSQSCVTADRDSCLFPPKVWRVIVGNAALPTQLVISTLHLVRKSSLVSTSWAATSPCILQQPQHGGGTRQACDHASLPLSFPAISSKHCTILHG